MSPSFGDCQLKKDVRRKSSELNFIWGKVSTAAQETAAQIALRNCSKEVVGEGQYMWFWWRGIAQCNWVNIFVLVTSSWYHLEGI